MILYFFDVFDFLPANDNILKWDAFWYTSIKTNGYYYHWYEPSNSAFFPLFPYLWKFLFLSNVGIALFNFVLLLLSLGLLYFNFDLNSRQLFIYLSIPSSIFFFLPFSESLFFLFGTIMLTGFHKNNLKLILMGLFFTSLTRATAMFFVPAIILMEFMNSEKLFDKKMLKNIALYSLTAIAGLLAVVLFQYAQTGEWFAFAKQQVKYWQHHFSLPGFPLISLGGKRILWIDLTAFLFSVTALVVAVVFALKKFLKKKSDINKQKAFWFSTGYLLMTVLYGLFFNPKQLDMQTTIEGTNRYVLASVFFLIFFTGAIKNFKPRIFNFICFGVIAVVTFLFFGLGGEGLLFLEKSKSNDFRNGIFFFCLFIYAALYYLSGSRKYGVVFSYILICINILLSALVLYDYTNGVFIA